MVIAKRNNGEVHLINEEEFRCIEFNPKERTLDAYPCSPEYGTTYLYDIISVTYGDKTFFAEPADVPRKDDFRNESVKGALYDEINRLDMEDMSKRRKNNDGRTQKSGIAIRFLSACHYNNIEAVGQLLDMGRDRFLQFRNIGNNCASLVSQALMNLYGVKF